MSPAPTPSLRDYVPRSRRSFWTWLRYNWPTFIIHLLLVVLGLLNLYPFFWMIGTSLKSIEEASDDRLRPYPVVKYRLADDFRLDRMMPESLDPGAMATVSDAEPLPVQLQKKLELLDRLQRAALTADVKRRVGDLTVSEAPKHKAAEAAVADLRRRVKALQKQLKDLTAKTPATGPASRPTTTAPAVAALQARLKADSEALAAAEKDLARLKEELARQADAMFDSLLQAGVLEADPAEGTCWLSDAAFERKLTGLTARQAAVVEGLWDYFVITLDEYLRDSGQSNRELAKAQLTDLRAAGVLKRVTDPDDPDTPLYRLADGARGAVFEGLRPRQVLMTWYLHKQNIVKAESYETFAAGRWSPDNYLKKFGLHDIDRAVKEIHELVDAGFLASGQFQAINYWVVLKEQNFLLHFLTSLLITIFVVFGTILLSSMLGYALARLRFPGKFLVLGIIIAAGILPGEARIIPIFKMLMALGGLQNLWGLVLWLTSFGVGNALLMAGFFLTLPKEVDEAAEVDGAGTFGKFFDIALPMARPIVMTVGLFAFLGAWNNFLVPLLCTIARPSMQPLAVAVYNFQEGHPGKWHEINAAASVMIIPVILLFLLVQKHVVKSIAVGAVKG